MPHLIEPATTGRSKCRGCGERIAAGALRFGEVLPNPFAEGETTHWFHLDCAAYKRPEPFLEWLAASPEPHAEAEPWRAEAERGVALRRLPRVAGAERDPSGRAQCRCCRARIAKGCWRIGLVFYEEGRFSPAGFIHPGCSQAYFETTDILPRLRRFTPGLTDAELNDLERELGRGGAGPSLAGA
jgi:Poly(ADP-ribose) polymerase and DNA-Ligase Zn-finger region